jgi:hypothetical protein
MDWQAGYRGVIDLNLSTVGMHQADYHVKTGGFPGTIGTQQADNLSTVDGN